MPGKSSTQRSALKALNEKLLKGFEAAGFDHISPQIIQPADVFLERAGEDIRSRTFVFTDPDGAELCLRPDLTVPTCRYHLNNAASPATAARYCYCGPAFRHQSGSSPAPREFEQAGLEIFGATDPQESEAEIFNLTIAAMEQAGLDDYTVRLGDLGLFHALLNSIDMPQRWRQRLAGDFWRPQAFHQLLSRITGQEPWAETSISPLLATITPDTVLAATEAELDRRGLVLVPGRSVDDIAARLADKVADRNAPPLDISTANLIDDYLSTSGGLEKVHSSLEQLAARTSKQFSIALTRLKQRCELFDLARLNNASAVFSGEFGRTLEYYTGFVFQIEAKDKSGNNIVVAGGGRYDNMISDIGNCEQVPAVGCAIYTERLLALTKERQ